MLDFAATDLILAVMHHLLVFTLAGILTYEIASIRPGLTAADIVRVAQVDMYYGILAGAILIVGFARVHLAAKGWDYYSVNPFFWAKMGSFALVGLLSIVPTMALLRWRKALKSNPVFLPAASEIENVRRFVWYEVASFGLILVFAAAMARIQ